MFWLCKNWHKQKHKGGEKHGKSSLFDLQERLEGRGEQFSSTKSNDQKMFNNIMVVLYKTINDTC